MEAIPRCNDQDIHTFSHQLKQLLIGIYGFTRLKLVVKSWQRMAICNERKKDGRNLDLYNEETGEGTLPKIIGNYDLGTPEGRSSGLVGAFAVSKGAVGIADLEGGTQRTAIIVNADPNSNLVESRTVLPTLQHTIKNGETVWYVTGIYAKPSGKGILAQSYLSGWKQKPSVPKWLQDEISSL